MLTLKYYLENRKHEINYEYECTLYTLKIDNWIVVYI